MVNCVYCHKDFERKTARGVSNRKIYCSTYCQQKSSYERRKKTNYWAKFYKPVPKQINCVVCDVPFKRKSGHRLTCSAKCYNYRKHQSDSQRYNSKITVEMTISDYRKWRKL